MSDSLKPAPKEIPSLHSKLKKTHSWVSLVAGSILSVVLVGFQAAQFLNTLATKQQVENLQQYMVSENVKLKQELDYSKKREAEMAAQLEELYDAVEDHLEKYSGEQAADRSEDKHKAAKAAKEARLKFREARAHHKTLKEAVISTYDDYFPF
jgi:uncharacterized membrane-anchored protein YhcB (DUF1043 family)